ncbi:MAG: type I methionyl aminopeptidase [Sandaracinus sp.]
MAFATLSAPEIEKMRRAGAVAAATLATVGARIRPGITTADIDAWVRADTEARGAIPSQLGYHGFPSTVCTSPNEVVCHGLPSRRRVLAPGDIVNVDVTSCLGGYHGDTSITFFVGEPSPEARRLVETARRCRDAGIAVVRHGARLGDIGAAIEEIARSEGMSVVRDFGGHGIGRAMHLAPHVPHVGVRGSGPRLVAGMAITVEPMINLGRAEVVLPDGEWNVVTADGSWSAQFEHTVLVGREGPEILTLPPETALRSASP